MRSSALRHPLRRTRCLLPALVTAFALSGCAVVAVADAAVTVAATAVKITAKTVGAVADVLIPDAAPAPQAAPPAAAGSR
ncbi:MAG TPA: hypothetical protein PK929_06620 [Quisquiliibacterium sp.]|jgi:hypothetical protein|nr:hypothetical protein [Quisquiliibacterium sp.]